MKKQLILVPSTKMDTNKKDGRYEDKLIRFGSKARMNLNLADEKTVELWPSTSAKDRINRSRTLNIFKAFSSDLKELKAKRMSIDDYHRVGFVTTKTFEYICGNGADGAKDVWISQSIDDTVIGGDPEFILLNEDGLVKYANNVAEFGHAGQLASDGPLAEIRPDPSISVSEFVDSITKILRTHRKAKAITRYDWMASCCWLGEGNDWGDHMRNEWPVGGHIHVGTPAQVATKCKADKLFERSFYVALCKILDELLAIPAMKIDNKKESIIRRKRYGAYGCYRTDHSRLEYRALSGMWMAHPKLATIILGTAKAIIDSFFHILEAKNFDTEYLNGGRDPRNVNFFDPKFNGWNNVGIAKDMGVVKSSKEMVALLNKYEMTYTKDYIAKLQKILRKLPAYQQYAEQIDGLIELISLPYPKLKKIDCDMKHTWIANQEFII